MSLPALKTPRNSFLPYGRQVIEDDDIAAVVEALRGDLLTTGPFIARFEQALARTHEQLSGNANLGYLGSDGELVVFNAYPNNRFHRFRVDGALVAATELHSADDSLFQLVFPAATDRRVISGAESLAQPEAAR